MARPTAYFSTFGGKFKEDRANGMKELPRSDADDGDDRLIALLRQRFPEECDSILDQITQRDSSKLNDWFDRNDIEAHGEEYLRNVINQIAFENLRSLHRLHVAEEFINERAKLKETQGLSTTEPSTTEPRKACDETFNKEEIDLYGRVFLEKALKNIWIKNRKAAPKGNLHLGHRDALGKETLT